MQEAEWNDFHLLANCDRCRVAILLGLLILTRPNTLSSMQICT